MEDLLKKERVSASYGKKPIIFVAPHGPDDDNTDIIAEVLAEEINGYAVINRGFKKSKHINVLKDEANCNSVEHCKAEVVKEEFLDPIIRMKKMILKKWTRVLIIYLHGVSNNIRIKSGVDKLNYIIGWGNPSRQTCQKWIKDYLMYNLHIADNCVVAEGKGGGNYAGWTKDNMNQFFRNEKEVESVQIEIVYDIRKTVSSACATAKIMAVCFNELLLRDDDFELPNTREYSIIKV